MFWDFWMMKKKTMMTIKKRFSVEEVSYGSYLYSYFSFYVTWRTYENE